MKLTAVEVKEFSDHLSDDWYFDGDIEIPDGFIEGTASPEDILEIEKGDVTIVYQGNDTQKDYDPMDFVSEFVKWKKNKTHATLVVTTLKSNEKALRDLIKKNGGMIK